MHGVGLSPAGRERLIIFGVGFYQEACPVQRPLEVEGVAEYLSVDRPHFHEEAISLGGKERNARAPIV